MLLPDPAGLGEGVLVIRIDQKGDIRVDPVRAEDGDGGRGVRHMLDADVDFEWAHGRIPLEVML